MKKLLTLLFFLAAAALTPAQANPAPGDQVAGYNSSTIVTPTPSVVGGGTNPLYVYIVPGTTIYTSLPSFGYGNTSFYRAEFIVQHVGSGTPTQSVKMVSLPFAPVSFIAWTDLFDNSSTSIGGLIQIGNGASSPNGSQTKNPSGCNNGTNSNRLKLTFGTAALTCSAGDTLILCTSATGTGGSQLTVTADAAVSSSASFTVRAITSYTAAPTTSDTYVYDQTTSTGFAMTYVGNSAATAPAWPSAVLFPSTNGSNTDINIWSNTVAGLDFLFRAQ